MIALAVRRLLAAGLMWSLAACTTFVPPPVSQPDPQAPEPRDSWARVLERFLDRDGRIDFAGLSRARGDLDRFVAWIYQTGPESRPGLFPTHRHVLAYHLNAYNALAMYAILDEGVPQSLAGLKKVHFFVLKRYQVDGRPISLYAYENEIIRPLGEPRVHFALNCMAVACPRLPREPFDAERLEEQLERETRYFFSEPRNVRVDDNARTIHLSEILDFYSSDFLGAVPTLAAYVNRYRMAPVPEEYSIVFTPYDWSVNRRPVAR